MTAHRTILNNIATAVANSETVRAYCVEHFSRGLAVQVGAYAGCFPTEKQAPFLWITPVEENEEIKEDETFTVRLILGACVTGNDGEKVINNVISERTDTTNGLTLNGGNETVENLRDMILELIRGTPVGAIPNRIRREENDIAHFPLEWATSIIEYYEPESLSS